MIIVLSILGIADSGCALYQHYAPPAASSCDVNETISCTAVNQSEYSVLLGLPVAGLGIAGYVVIAAFSVGLLLGWCARLTRWLLLAFAGAALVFSLWLTWVELFVLEAVCPLCVISLALVTSITLLAAVILISNKESRRRKNE